MEEIILPVKLPNENISKYLFLANIVKRKISDLISYIIILTFTYAALRILADYKMFIKEIYALTVLNVVKWGLAVICICELTSVVLLIIPKYRLIGLTIAFIIMFVLNIISLIILQRAPLIPSKYFGEIFHSVSFYGHLIINISTLIIILIGIITLPKHSSHGQKMFK
jgi:hypothetical protein